MQRFVSSSLNGHLSSESVAGLRHSNALNLISSVRDWATRQGDILAAAVVGSYARGTERPDSDVDLVLLVADPAPFLRTTAWVEAFGAITSISCEDWGRLKSLRVFYQEGTEVEFGIAGADWASTQPLDAGTAGVVSKGLVILVDPHGLLDTLRRCVEHGTTMVDSVGRPGSTGTDGYTDESPSTE
jgi:uncharacterized protein